MNILELVELAQKGAEWERGNAVGVDNIHAMNYAFLMKRRSAELERILAMLRAGADAAELPAVALLKIRRRRAKAEVAV